MNESYVNADPDTISTLDEPVLDTLTRDAKAIGRKLVAVVYPPLGDEKDLRDWDLWGPLFLCLILSSILTINADKQQGSIIFSAVFIFVWLGGLVVTLNAKFLGSSVMFFQTYCAMGYCLAPICVAALFCWVMPFFLVNLFVCALMWGWSCWAALRFFRNTVPEDREALVVYPVGLFYLFFTWMIIVGV
ncbi:terbinafine resistance locus protein (yip1) (HTBF) [Leptomonas seymouri]|uniref:Protein YIPF n=1 Tax=Leptomonas seymouri TaxID=5684 RepID=A0A0N0P2J5_LEPSE|nr:terbinafine resistance locus protein (yip1) (HTBF) [Leptomonas seymouri]|eukprot:KPI83026.1 terbinafine resistance locus protein (yip1) (HTBF) [Leptomonas seymouri]